jgi:hypothetical protein
MQSRARSAPWPWFSLSDSSFSFCVSISSYASAKDSRALGSEDHRIPTSGRACGRGRRGRRRGRSRAGRCARRTLEGPLEGSRLRVEPAPGSAYRGHSLPSSGTEAPSQSVTDRRRRFVRRANTRRARAVHPAASRRRFRRRRRRSEDESADLAGCLVRFHRLEHVLDQVLEHPFGCPHLDASARSRRDAGAGDPGRSFTPAGRFGAATV